MDCIIIDDEPLAHRVIKNYCSNLSFLEVVKTCHSAMEGLDFLSSNEVDLIFLDINMPMIKGLDFLKTLKNPPLVIITTAYEEFALEGYELSVIDYLLKPFSLERFLKAVNKAQMQLKLLHSADQTKSKASSTAHVLSNDSTAQSKVNYIFIKSDKKNHKVQLKDIQYLAGYGSYVKVHFKKEVIVTLERLTHFEHLLPENLFIRVHRSYIVAIGKIKTIAGNRIEVDGAQIPIGKVYKRNLQSILK